MYGGSTGGFCGEVKLQTTSRSRFPPFGMAPLVLTVHLLSSLHGILSGRSVAVLLWLCEVFDEVSDDKFLHKVNEGDLFQTCCETDVK